MKLAKIFTAISLIVFTATVVGLLTAGYIDRANKKNDSGTSSDISGSTFSILTSAEVAKHSSAADCWMIINSAVYNLTSYFTSHPGGANTILPYCGRDGSQAFATKDLSPASTHSVIAKNLLDQYFVGRLGQQLIGGIPSPTLQPESSLPVTPTPDSATSPDTVLKISLTPTEITRHNQLSDCWLIISGKVYDVTRYIAQHPGGAYTIANMCGRESTTAFQTKGGQGSNHSGNAYNLLANYFIGNLNSSVQIVPPNVSGTSSPSLPSATTNNPPGATESRGYEDD